MQCRIFAIFSAQIYDRFSKKSIRFQTLQIYFRATLSYNNSFEDNNKPYLNLNLNYDEVHSCNRLRVDVRLRKRCDRSQDSRSQVHPQPRIWRFHKNRVPGFSKERVQAALSVLESTYQRPDPCLEQARSVSGRSQRPGYQFEDLRR